MSKGRPTRTNDPAPRPEKGRAVFYHRDSGGKHETTPGEYLRRTMRQCLEEGLKFRGTPELLAEMIREGNYVCGDMFVDWGVSGNQLSRPGLDALFDDVRTDREVTHVFIPRPDRLARPDQIEQGLELEDRFRRELGVTLVFKDRVCRPLKRGEKQEFGEWIAAAVAYDRAEKERRELAQKMIDSQIARARQGFLTGGRAPYGFQRWLIGPDGEAVRALEDGEIVRREGHHVIPLPKDDGTFETRKDILEMLVKMPARQVAKFLNEKNRTTMQVPPPDHGRIRRDGGIAHTTSGLWHQTTITKIGRDPINSAVIPYGRRSMGDRQRFSPQGPRDLEDTDYTGDKPKVIQNADDQVILGRGRFTPIIGEDQLRQLRQTLDDRGGTQRGKPRSRSPENNPLGGGRIIDMDCAFPMYRSPYQDGFRYVCSAYMQSHGQRCHHNHMDGPTAVRLLLSVAQQRVLWPNLLDELRGRIEAIAQRELNANTTAVQVNSKRAELVQIRSHLDRAGKNMALAENPVQFAQVAKIFEEYKAQEIQAEAEIQKLDKRGRTTNTIASEVAAAMEAATSLLNGLKNPGDIASPRGIFESLNAKLFICFRDERWGKRTLRKPGGAVVTFGLEPPPVQVYSGRTDRAAVKNAAAQEPAYYDESNGPGREGDSLGNVNRIDRTPVELFRAGIANLDPIIQHLILAA